MHASDVMLSGVGAQRTMGGKKQQGSSERLLLLLTTIA
jgi:hypothetical protein